MHNREPVTPRLLWKSLKDFDLWPLYILGLMFQIPTVPPVSYLTLILKSLGWSTFDVNLLTIPYYVGHSMYFTFWISYAICRSCLDTHVTSLHHVGSHLSSRNMERAHVDSHDWSNLDTSSINRLGRAESFYHQQLGHLRDSRGSTHISQWYVSP